jgi:predicted O-methyltransferase YrrM
MAIKNQLRRRFSKFLTLNKNKSDLFRFLNQSVLEVNNLIELKRNFKWKSDPIIDNPIYHEFDYSEDLNERRLRDAESLGAVVRNILPHICVDIGTAMGYSAALMAINAPSSTIYTINILPEEIESGAGGVFTTGSFTKEEIGTYYKQRNFKNISQIYANSATWEPDFNLIDLAFIDGSHDTEFVYNDSLKMIKRMKAGSFILWHDFNLELTDKYYWINSVCLGVEKLFRDGYLKGRIFHLRDSWVGIYQVIK